MTELRLRPCAAALVLIGCHTITEELPTQPTQHAGPGRASSRFRSRRSRCRRLPTPTPTPTPAPTATPTPAPARRRRPTPAPPSGSGCGNPLPPAVTRMNAKIHIKGPNLWTLDTTPLVGPDAEYCRKIGFTDGRSLLPGADRGQRPSAWRARRTRSATRRTRDGRGRRGTRNGKLCTGGDDCENHPDNQYLLWAYGSGYYEACTKDDSCAARSIVEGEPRHGDRVTAGERERVSVSAVPRVPPTRALSRRRSLPPASWRGPAAPCSTVPDPARRRRPSPWRRRPPAQPSPNPTPDADRRRPVAPRPTPTPDARRPEPSPGPTPTPSTGWRGPAAAATRCRRPLASVNVKVHLRGGRRAGSSTRRRSSAPTPPTARRSASPTRARSARCGPRATRSARRASSTSIGRAKDTGRPGPTWYRGGGFCTGRRERLREPRRQPVPAARLRGRHLPGLRAERRLRRGRRRQVARALGASGLTAPRRRV